MERKKGERGKEHHVSMREKVVKKLSQNECTNIISQNVILITPYGFLQIIFQEFLFFLVARATPSYLRESPGLCAYKVRF